MKPDESYLYCHWCIFEHYNDGAGELMCLNCQGGSNFKIRYEVEKTLKKHIHECSGFANVISNVVQIGNQEAIFRSKSKPSSCGGSFP